MIVTTIASFARPADTTQYAAGDLVADNTTAGSVTPLKFTTSGLGRGRGTIKRARLYKSGTAVTAAVFVLHLFAGTGGAPAVTNGDNGAFAIASAANYLGSINVDLSSGAVVGTVGTAKHAAPSPEITFDLTKVNNSERRIYGYLVTGTGGTYTPASAETFEVTLDLSVED